MYWSQERARARHDLPHGLRSIGHCCFELSVLIHLRRQCMWNTCEHSPQTGDRTSRCQLECLDHEWRGEADCAAVGKAIRPPPAPRGRNRDLLSGHPSPGVLQSGQHPSYPTLQIPHTSSSSFSSSSSSSPSASPPPEVWPGPASGRDVGGLRFHRQCATASNLLTVTFIALLDRPGRTGSEAERAGGAECGGCLGARISVEGKIGRWIARTWPRRQRLEP